jgi:hypothetical protein
MIRKLKIIQSTKQNKNHNIILSFLITTIISSIINQMEKILTCQVYIHQKYDSAHLYQQWVQLIA